MVPFRFTLISEGPTDASLIPVIQWILREVGGCALSEGQRADFWRLRKPPNSLAEKICAAAEYFPCEALFIHRDADRESPAKRTAEIEAAVKTAQVENFNIPAIALVPVRMLEAWLLFDERAVRHAAGNPYGVTPLNLPNLNKIETRPNPKDDLQQALITASELSGRRRKKFDVHGAFWRLTDHIDDFSALRKLSAYCAFEDAIKKFKAHGFTPGFYG